MNQSLRSWKNFLLSYKIDKAKHIDNRYSKVLQKNMEEHKEENIIQSVGDIVEEAMNKNKKEDEIKRSVIIHKLEETHMNNFDDIIKADMNKLSVSENTNTRNN